MVIIEKQSDFLTTITICQHLAAATVSKQFTGQGEEEHYEANRAAICIRTDFDDIYTVKDEWLFHWICVINSKIMVSRRILLKNQAITSFSASFCSLLLTAPHHFFSCKSCPSSFFCNAFFLVFRASSFISLLMKSGVTDRYG